MKNFRIALAALLMMGFTTGVVNAQDKATDKKSTSTKTSTSKSSASGQHLKKDGTPDMRYKENKQAPAKGSDTKASSSKTSAPAKGSSSGKSSGGSSAPSKGSSSGKSSGGSSKPAKNGK